MHNVVGEEDDVEYSGVFDNSGLKAAHKTQIISKVLWNCNSYIKKKAIKNKKDEPYKRFQSQGQVKVIETNMSMYVMHRSTIMRSLNAIAYNKYCFPMSINVIETTISKHAMYKSTVMPIVNAIA